MLNLVYEYIAGFIKVLTEWKLLFINLICHTAVEPPIKEEHDRLLNMDILNFAPSECYNIFIS